MEKEFIIQKVKSNQFNKEQLLEWLRCLSSSPEKRKPTEYKVGDVLMHSVFQHPYVLLKKRKNDWLCGLITSEAGCPEILEECQSRFFNEKYFTKTLFSTTEIKGSFINVYDNKKHLFSVLKRLIENLDL